MSQMTHMRAAFAFALKATTQEERIAAVLLGVIILMAAMFAFRRLFGDEFYNGFMVSSGLFLSFDIVVFHWIFQLHRITSGPEANILEPIFVLFGLALLMFGVRGARRLQSAREKRGLE